MKSRWTKLADMRTVEKTMEALGANGIEASFVESGEEAKKELLRRLPEQAEVMTMTSRTLEAIGAAQEILGSGKYRAVKNILAEMDPEKDRNFMQKLGAAPEWTVGSVHAVTERGQVMIASATGSQLPAYAYGSLNVVWVVGTQKIVADQEEGFQRIYQYSFPREDERAREVYGIGSQVGKVLIVNKEAQPGRLSLIFVAELLGF
ncbi:MAG: LUD domain-containing protein [Candidatus Aquicultorales bacterium]